MAIDLNKIKANPSITPLDIRQFDAYTGNIYEIISIVSKRANQINIEIKDIIREKLEEYRDSNDTLEEVIENPEQANIALFFEKLPKPTAIAIDEFLDNKINYRYSE